MSLLYTKQPIVVNPQLAKSIGLNEAIVLQQLHYWLSDAKNGGSRGGVECEGVRWIHNTHDDWQQMFPFWSTDTIMRIFKNLKSEGLIFVEQKNKSSYDRTNFYTINYSHYALVDDCNLPSNDTGNLPPSDNRNLPLSLNKQRLPETTTDTNACDFPSENTPEKCPVQKIVDLYNEILVDLPSVKRLTEDRKRKIVKLWNDRKKAGKYTDNEAGLAYWKQLFEFITESDFLMGRQGGNWKASIDFIFTDSRFTKIIERTYHKEQQ